MEPKIPFDEQGRLDDRAWMNIAIALLMRAGGAALIQNEELEESNLRLISYSMTDRGFAMTLLDARHGRS